MRASPSTFNSTQLLPAKPVNTAFIMRANSVSLATGGSLPTHVGLVVVTDASEREMFRFNVADRFTEKGLSNAASKEIVKRFAVVLGK